MRDSQGRHEYKDIVSVMIMGMSKMETHVEEDAAVGIRISSGEGDQLVW